MTNATANRKRIKIKGADYASFDTGDGYIVVRDVVVCGEIPEGVKGAPKQYRAEELQALVNKSQTLYQKGFFCSAAHKGHNKQLELQDPEFLGFVLPKRVGRAVIDAVEQDAIFADVKLKASAFERAMRGELPFISPEIDWAEDHIRGIAFLDSKCPHFKAPLFTVLEPVQDEAAKFQAVPLTVAHFEKGEGKPFDKKGEKDGGDDKPGAEGGEGEKPAADMAATPGAAQGMGQGNAEARIVAMETLMMQVAKMLGLPFGGFDMSDKNAVRPGGAPAEQPNAAPPTKANSNDAKMEAAGEAAKFAALEGQYEGRIAALESKDKAREDAARVQGLVDRTITELKGFPLTDGTKSKIAKFAAAGEDVLKAFVEAFKESVPKDTPATKGAFEANPSGVDANDPVVAKFQAQGPAKMEYAIRAAAEWAQLSTVKGFTVKKDRYVDLRVAELTGKKA